MSERHVWIDLGMTDSEARALATQCCANTDSPALKAFGDKLAGALNEGDPDLILNLKHETKAVEDYHDSDDCTECEIEKIHRESNDEMCLTCLTEGHPDHWFVREAAALKAA